MLFTLSSVIKPDSVLESVNAKLDSAAYNEMALEVFNDKEDPAAVVTEWLQSEDLI